MNLSKQKLKLDELSRKLVGQVSLGCYSASSLVRPM